MAYRRLQEHVGAFREFLRSHGKTPEERELVAAKLMGRCAAARRWYWHPTRTSEPRADMQRNNDFNYKEMDPHGYAVPLGSHCRRMNPRDTAMNMNRRRMIRRGATYGSPLPEDHLTTAWSADRRIRDLRKLNRQFEFAQNVWANDKTFTSLATSVIR